MKKNDHPELKDAFSAYSNTPLGSGSSNNKNESSSHPVLSGVASVLLIGGVGAAAFLASRYKVARSNEYIVKTGLFIENIDVSKKAFHLPFQTIAYIDMAPKSYNFTIHAMSKEKMEFFLPGVFTIGPKDSKEHLQNFAKYLLFETDDNINDIVRGMIEGETRVLAANLSIEEIFKGRNEFKDHILLIEENFSTY